MYASVFAALHSRAPGQSSILQAQSAVQFWLDRESSYKKVSQLAVDLVASPASQAFRWTIILAVWWSDSKKTEQY